MVSEAQYSCNIMQQVMQFWCFSLHIWRVRVSLVVCMLFQCQCYTGDKISAYHVLVSNGLWFSPLVLSWAVFYIAHRRDFSCHLSHAIHTYWPKPATSNSVAAACGATNSCFQRSIGASSWRLFIDHSFIPLAYAEFDDSLPFLGASSIPLCYVLFPATLPLQIFFHPLTPSCHLFLGLPLNVLVTKFIYNTLLGILFSSILCSCPNQRNLFNLLSLL